MYYWWYYYYWWWHLPACHQCLQSEPEVTVAASMWHGKEPVSCVETGDTHKHLLKPLHVIKMCAQKEDHQQHKCQRVTAGM